ncbi:MAG: SDR family NAD(P)-dependent oxidoreductase [Gordonia sp. (in: high G+C Gram-positive bacteria)]|uniref:SDR family NAD(P)-dependent oxidoreductase n=1 Tax=Gordonia sp. (in: high G+C Gram-positive bacteria) TaxID=84139 RepID=UPI0039E37F55
MSPDTLANPYTIVDQVALITGAGGAIGGAVARVFARSGGAKVALADLAGNPRHHELAEQLRAEGFEALVERVVTELGPVDVLVNNAGIADNTPFWETAFEDWRRGLTVHLDGTYLLTRHVIESMRERGSGNIVTMSSIAAQQGALTGDAAYSAAKAGQQGFTKTLAQTLGPSGIRANCIAPGVVDTPLLHSVHDEESLGRILQRVPMRSLIDPENIATTALYLASPGSAHVTGQTIDVGGMVMR